MDSTRDTKPARVITNRCVCGWQVSGTQDEVVLATQDHGRRLHNMLPTRDEIDGLAGRPGGGGSLMQVPKPTEADKARFRSIVPDDPRVDVKPMFGNLGAFVNGAMFMGLFGAQVGVKVSPEDAAALRAIDGAGPFGPAERPMGGYVSLPADMAADPDGLAWARRALGHVAALPPKPAKPR